jgi:hypothetical protein
VNKAESAREALVNRPQPGKEPDAAVEENQDISREEGELTTQQKHSSP